MRKERTIPRSLALRFFAVLLSAAAAAGCRPTDPPSPPPVNRLVLVVDPTVLRDADAAEFNQLLGDRLRRAVGELPEDTFVDLLFVEVDQLGRPVEFRDSLPFDQYGTGEAHQARARAMGDSLAKLAGARWEVSNEQPNRPSSCILTALYRAQEMTQEGARRGENVALVVLSDLLEACSDTGYNFEREIPDSIGALPVTADLSGADRVLLLRMQTGGAVVLEDEARLLRVWTDMLKRWRVDERVLVITPNFPGSFVQSEPRHGDAG